MSRQQCRQPGASVLGITLAHGINANLVRKWIVKHPGANWRADAVVTFGARLVTQESAQRGAPGFGLRFAW